MDSYNDTNIAEQLAIANEITTSYGEWRTTLYKQFTDLYQSLTRQYTTLGVSLTERGCDRLFNAWTRLQKIYSETMPARWIVNDKLNRPSWFVAVLEILTSRDQDKLCRNVLSMCIERLKSEQ